jgi:transposase
MVRQRIFLVRIRTRIKNRIHAVLDRNHLAVPAVTDLFGKKGMNYLQGVELEGIDGEILRECMTLMEQLNSLIHTTESEITCHVLGENRPSQERPYQIRQLPLHQVPASAALITE